jgi:hypothetical protein
LVSLSFFWWAKETKPNRPVRRSPATQTHIRNKTFPLLVSFSSYALAITHGKSTYATLALSTSQFYSGTRLHRTVSFYLAQQGFEQ